MLRRVVFSRAENADGEFIVDRKVLMKPTHMTISINAAEARGHNTLHPLLRIQPLRTVPRVSPNPVNAKHKDPCGLGCSKRHPLSVQKDLESHVG